MRFSRNFIASSVLLSVLLACGLASRVAGGGPRVINVIADKDNRFKVPGQTNPVITVKANEVIRLRITAHKATEWDKDGTVHTFTIKELKDQGWDLRLKEGVQEFTLAAPGEPGEYLVECTVKCGDGHDDMKMKLIVTE
jgi:heme/copper-type cytochrome/quinol oxidase subunit 2